MPIIKQILTLKKNYYHFCNITATKPQPMQPIPTNNNSKKPKNFPQFTHFASIPFIRPSHRSTLGHFQTRIQQIFQEHNLSQTIRRANTDLMHVTLSMLTLNLQEYRDRTVDVIRNIEKEIVEHLDSVSFRLGEIRYFTRYDRKEKKECVTLVYFQLVDDESVRKLQKVTDLFIRAMVKEGVIDSNELKAMHIKYDHRDGMYKNEAFHLTLFRVNGLEYDEKFKEVMEQVKGIKGEKSQENEQKKNENAVNMVLQCDFVDISTRGHYDGTNFYLPLARVVVGGGKSEGEKGEVIKLHELKEEASKEETIKQKLTKEE